MEHPNFASVLFQLPKRSVLITNSHLVTISKVNLPFLYTTMILLDESQI